MSYSDKLKDPRWQKRRLEIFKRDKWKCRQCKSGTKTLSVHHIFYLGEPWEMDGKWLITVCDDCHKKLEAEKGKPLNLTDKDYERIYRRMNRARKKK